MKAQGDLHMINFHLLMTQIQAFRPISTGESYPDRPASLKSISHDWTQ